MGLELNAISSAVIGGTLLTGGVGTVIGSMVSVLIQGIIQAIVTYQNLNTWWTKVEDETMKRAAVAFGNLKFRNKMVLSTLLVTLIPLLLLSTVVATVLVRDVRDEYWWQYAIDRQGMLGVVGSVVGRNNRGLKKINTEIQRLKKFSTNKNSTVDVSG